MLRRILAVALLLLAVGVSAVEAQERTVLIRGGRVLDGSGNPWIRADVLLEGDRVAAVGQLGDVSADEVIEIGRAHV